MKTKNELIKNWLEKAEKDLRTAKHEISFQDAVTESICFHCQQAVEKFIKAYLVFLDVTFFKTHEIGELITKCEEKDKQISAFKEEADSLTGYAVEIRYPEELMIPSLAEAKEAFDVAMRVRKFVLSKIKLV